VGRASSAGTLGTPETPRDPVVQGAGARLALPTWAELGYPGRSDHRVPTLQEVAAQRLQVQYGCAPWPGCRAKLGLP
jgi:hypothetical protein